MGYYNTAIKMKKLATAARVSQELEKEINGLILDSAIEEGRLRDLVRDYPELYDKYFSRRPKV